MLLQTNAYSVPFEQREAHARLVTRIQDAMRRHGVTIEVFEEVGPAFSPAEEATGRFVQILRFRDRRQAAAMQAAERADPMLQGLLAEFVNLVDLPSQVQRGTYLPGYYNAITPEALP